MNKIADQVFYFPAETVMIDGKILIRLLPAVPMAGWRRITDRKAGLDVIRMLSEMFHL